MTTETSRSTASVAVVTRVALRSLVVLSALALIGVLVVALVAGGAPAWGVAVGAGLVVIFFGSGFFALRLLLRDGSGLAAMIALSTYAMQVVLVIVVLVLLNRSGLFETTIDKTWLGGTVGLATLLFTGTMLLGMQRARIAIYDEPAAHDEGATEAPDAGAR